MTSVRLEHLGAVELLNSLPENSIDAVVCDPPYEIGFMNQNWDRSGVAFNPATWAAALRVLKPGGHLLSFASARTYHRIACAIEDGGFEIRDQIMWITGQGMPKSVDVGWALHQLAAEVCGEMIEVSSAQAESLGGGTESTPTVPTRKESSPEHKLRFVRATYLQTPVYACAECGQVLQPFLSKQESPALRAAWSKTEPLWEEQSSLAGRGNLQTSQGELQRCEVCTLSSGVVADGAEGWVHRGASSGDGSIPWQVANADGSRPSYRPQSVEQLAQQPTAFSIECRAQGLRGFGSSLKPAHEPIVVARKRFVTTLTCNVLTHGTGAINIDRCRVEHVTVGDGNLALNPHLRTHINGGNGGHIIAHEEKRRVVTPNQLGRWPANICHDGSDEVLECFPDAPGQQAAVSTTAPSVRTSNVYGKMKRQGEASADRRYTDNGSTNFAATPGERRFDTGSAARFFYCAKPSRKERNYGMEDPGPQFKHGSTLRQIENTDTRGNTHPTVKPLALMRWLVRLVTPLGGTVLDPFVGSGTTGMAAVLEGFNFIGGDSSADYLEIAKARMTWAEKEAGDGEALS